MVTAGAAGAVAEVATAGGHIGVDVVAVVVDQDGAGKLGTGAAEVGEAAVAVVGMDDAAAVDDDDDSLAVAT